MAGEMKIAPTGRGTENLSPFVRRHIGPGEDELEQMLEKIGVESLDGLIDRAIPDSIRLREPLSLPAAVDEREALEDLGDLAGRNRRLRSMIGMGYADCITPSVIRRTILENPGWYTAYTPYQAEISQGRLEALLNFQTMVAELTGFEVANASLLDEATAAAEAMTLCRRARRSKGGEVFLVSDRCHPQTIAVVQTRAEAIGITVEVGPHSGFEFRDGVFGALVQYPDTDGSVEDFSALCDAAHEADAMVVVATDLLALTLLKAPGEFGADVAIGNSQRFGVPLGYGGPHAAFLASHAKLTRQLPGRLIGVSRDAEGRPAFRMALQTREQHIRRDKATSNICTAQVLLAVIASMYAVYHGPDGLKAIATRVRRYAAALEALFAGGGLSVRGGFDTLKVDAGERAEGAFEAAAAKGINLRRHDDGQLGISLDETTRPEDLLDLLLAFGLSVDEDAVSAAIAAADGEPPAEMRRQSSYLGHPVFNSYHSETEFLRYTHRLEMRDLALNTSMIPLGSCTMKLNAATEMYPISDPGFAGLHPFAPVEQAEGYREMFERLENWLADITGMAAVSLQPNSGAQGEYAGLLVIRAYHRARGDEHRNVCLIPQSAHGTNPASASLASMKVVVVACDDQGNIDVDDLRARAEQHRDHLAALMVTYPSTHGVFEEAIGEICSTVHECGGQVYMDGANMNAMVGLCRPGEFGADVLHLNLHKTFCIPHGGGGPGMGPIAVGAHLAPFLPSHPLIEVGGDQAIGPVSAAPWGSPSILPISYAYIAMMGADGLTRASQVAILNANYVARRLEGHYNLLYTNREGFVAHECIVDPRPFKDSAGISAEDIAKRLMDYGFHAPTMSFPVAGTLMIEPTESEAKAELDRFCDAMISIREEIREVEAGAADRENNVLRNAPHTAAAATADNWDRPYSREKAVYPLSWVREAKFWPASARIDNAHGDRHLMCSCPPMEAYAE